MRAFPVPRVIESGPKVCVKLRAIRLIDRCIEGTWNLVDFWLVTSDLAGSFHGLIAMTQTRAFLRPYRIVHLILFALLA
jgi:hypothetical protein